MMKAKAICAKCPVRPECLAFALRTDQVHGVWGGMSEQERRPLRSAVKAAERRTVRMVAAGSGGVVHLDDVERPGGDHAGREQGAALPLANSKPKGNVG